MNRNHAHKHRIGSSTQCKLIDKLHDMQKERWGKGGGRECLYLTHGAAIVSGWNGWLMTQLFMTGTGATQEPDRAEGPCMMVGLPCAIASWAMCCCCCCRDIPAAAVPITCTQPPPPPPPPGAAGLRPTMESVMTGMALEASWMWAGSMAWWGFILS